MAKKNYVYGGKAVAVMEWLNKEPSASDAHIAKYVGCHPTYVKQIRRKMIHAQKEAAQEVVDKEEIGERLYQISRGRQARMADAASKPGEYIVVEGAKSTREIDAILDTWRNEPEIDEVLTARHNNYGSFYDLARLAQEFKNITQLHLIHANKHLEADQHEALEFIFTKIARILNGNADNVDSWVDIAGYAKLVADRLQGTVR